MTDRIRRSTQPAVPAAETPKKSAVAKNTVTPNQAKPADWQPKPKPKPGKVKPGDGFQSTEPKLPKEKDPVSYKQVPGAAFDDKVEPEDVVQGELGDCFFLSSLSSLAEQHPDAIRNAIKTRPDGTYDVTLFQKQKDGSFKPVSVHIDGELPEDKSGLAFASSKDKDELWPALMEKAYAQFQKGYTTLDKGGDETDAMEALTGKPATQTNIDPKNADQIYQQLKDAISNGQLTCAGTFTNKDLKAHLQKYASAGLLPRGIDTTYTYKKDGMVDGHAYTVTGVHEENGEKYVDLRNPWGEDGPNDDQTTHGEFKMPLSQFAVLYEEISVGGK